jgi:hypothetical protein
VTRLVVAVTRLVPEHEHRARSAKTMRLSATLALSEL